MTTPKELLVEALDLLERSSWTQGKFAADRVGSQCVASSPDAKCFCLLGAVNRIAYSKSAETLENMPIEETYDVLGKALESFRGVDIRASSSGERVVIFNDAPGRTKEDVLKLLRKAIQIA